MPWQNCHRLFRNVLGVLASIADGRGSRHRLHRYIGECREQVQGEVTAGGQQRVQEQPRSNFGQVWHGNFGKGKYGRRFK